MTSINLVLILDNFGLFPVNLFIIGTVSDLAVAVFCSVSTSTCGGEFSTDFDSCPCLFSVIDMGVLSLACVSPDDGSEAGSSGNGGGESHNLTRILTLVLSIHVGEKRCRGLTMLITLVE